MWRREAPHSIEPNQLTWPVDRETLNRAVVAWPSGYDMQIRNMWGDQIRRGLERFVRVERRDIPQTHKGVIEFWFTVGRRRLRVSIDTSDYPRLKETAYDDCDLHFKLQHLKEGYGDRDRLLPGAFVNADPVVYRYLRRLRAARDTMTDAFEVYGRFELTMDKRRVPLEILAGSDRFRFQGGQGKVRYSRYLREVARSAVCIDLSGTANITFRLYDYLAVGACIVGPRHTCQFQYPLVEGEHVAYCKDDFSDLENVCERYLRNDADRKRLIRNSRAFFDSYLHRDQVATYYLHHCLRLLD